MRGSTDMPDNRVNIVTKPSMFKPDLYYTKVPDGATLIDVVGPNVGADVAILVNDTRIPHQNWGTTRVFHEDIVSIAIFPANGGDGGKDPLRTIAMIAVVVVASIYGGPMMGAMGLKGMAVGGLSWASVGTGIIMTGGMMAVNALIPAQTPTISSASALADMGTPAAAYSITGGQNRSRPYGVVQKVFGFTRFFPDLAANPYTEIRGNDQYFYMLLSAGYANIAASALKVGDTAIDDYEDTQYEVGYIDEITLFRNNVVEDSQAAKIGLGESITRGLEDGETDHTMSVDVCFSQGLRSVSAQGQDGWAEVQIQIEYSEAGEDAWQLAIIQTFHMAAKDPVREHIPFTAATVSEGVDVRISNTVVNFQYGQYTFSDCYVTAVRSVKSGPAVIDPGRKFLFIAVEMRATDQVNGVVDNISCYGESYLPVYNGTNWIYQKTNNPAWAYAEGCHGEQLAHPAPYSKIDGATLAQWAAWCDLNGFTYNNIHDTETTMLDHLRNIAAAGRAAWALTDGLFSVVMDTLQTVPVQMISPRNSWGFKAKKVFPDPPHAMKVKYIDPVGLDETTRIVYADGYDETNATRFETLPTIGCQDPDMAWKIGRYYLAECALRPEEYYASMDFENLRCRRGSLVVLAHDVLQVGLAWGRVKQVVDATTIITDELLSFETGVSYVIRFRMSSGAQEMVSASGAVGQVYTVTLGTEVTGLAPGDLFIFGVAGKASMDAKVKHIDYNADLSADLTLVPAAPEILDADQGPIPAFDPLITSPVNPKFVAPAIPELIFFEAFESVSGSSIASLLVVGFHVPAGSPAAQKVQVKYQYDGNWLSGTADAVDGVVSISDVPPEGTVIEFKARSRSIHNVWSQFCASVNYTVSYASVIAPETVTGFSAVAVLDGIQLAWDNPVALQITKFKVRRGASFEAGTSVFDGLAASCHDSDKAAGSRTYWIVSVNEKRVSTPVSVAIDVDVPADPAVTLKISDGIAMLDWGNCMTTFPIRHYKVTSGTDIHYISNTQYAEKITWTGNKAVKVQAVDIGGNISAEVTVTVATPAAPTVTGLSAAGSVHSIVIRADYSYTAPEEIEVVEIHGSTTNDRAGADLITTLAPGSHSYVHPGIPLLQDWYYWARIKNAAKVYSDWYPAGATAGIQGTPSDDPADYVKMFDAMISDGDLLSQFAWTSLKDFFEWEGTGTFTISDGNQAVGLANAVVNGLAAIEQRMIALDTSSAAEYVDTEVYPINKVVTWQGKYYRKIKPSVAGISPANTTFWTAMTAGILNQWVLRMNANGHVAGMGMSLDDSGDSEFIVQSDKFAVVTDDPAAPGTPMSMFQVGLVNGVTMVGVRGDMMLDGTVGAKAMKTDELFIGLTIQSLDFISGSTGWKIDANGIPEFNGGIFRGSIHLGAGSTGYPNLDDTPDTSANWSGNEIPTLLNEPAVNWTTDDAKVAHVENLYSTGSAGYQFTQTGEFPDELDPEITARNELVEVSEDGKTVTATGTSGAMWARGELKDSSYLRLAFKISGVASGAFIGFGSITGNTGFVNIQFSFEITPTEIRVREYYGQLYLDGDGIGYTDDSVLEIECTADDAVNYYLDGVLIYTSTQTFQDWIDKFVDIYLYDQGACVSGITLFTGPAPVFSWEKVWTEDSDIRSPNDGTLLNPEVIDPGLAYTVGDPVNGPYAIFNAGEITFYQYFAGVLRSVKTLKQISPAIVDSGEWHTIDGHWANPPSVYAAPVDTLSFHYNYVSQSQKQRIGLTDVELVSDGIYRAKGDSFLESQDGSTIKYPGLSCSGSVSANTSSYSQLSANTRKITANMRLSGCCGEWFDGDWHRCYITIRAKLVYYTNGSWIDSPWTAIYTVSHSSYQNTVVTTPTEDYDIEQAYLHVEKVSNTRSIYQIDAGTNYVGGVLDSLTCSLAGGSVITLGRIAMLFIGE